MLRTAVFALLVGTVVAAHASFEMMLLPGADGRNYRYDPVNNVSLGSYRGFSSATMVTADLNGLSYSSNNGNISVYAHSYSTGLATGAITASSSSVATHVVNGSLYVMSQNDIKKYSTTTGALQATILTGGQTTFRSMTSFGNRLIALGYTVAGALTSQTFDMTTLASSTLNTYAISVTLGTDMGRAASIRNDLSNTNLVGLTYVTGAGNLSFLRIPLNNDGTIVGASFSQTTLTQYSFANLMPSALAGHNSMYLYGQDVATPTAARLLQYETTNGVTLNTSSTFTAPGGFRAGEHNFQGAILVAPEPGTMIGLCLGLAAIARRRRVKK